MLILSLDTSSADLSIALQTKDTVLGFITETMQRGHGEALIPYIQSLMDKAGKSMEDIKAVAVAVGPGSFTGVRVGLSAARGIGLALDIPVYGVTNLEAMAYGMNKPVTVVLDTKRGDYYAQRFDDKGEALDMPTIKSADQFKYDLPFSATGDGALKLAEEINCSAETKKEATAISVGKIAFSRMDNPLPAEPLYLRDADVTLKA